MTKYGDDNIPAFIVAVWIASILVSFTVAGVILWAIIKVVSALTN